MTSVTVKTKPQTVLPEGVEITRCKKSRRGRKLKIDAQHKPHKHRMSWDAAEAFAAQEEKA
jgi:hypothetical protein